MFAYITRDSVCAGDDGDAPHRQKISIPGHPTIAELLRLVLIATPLPHISGGQATWYIASRIPLAVMAQQWVEPRMLNSIPPKLFELDIDGDTLRLHVSYFAQRDPDVVFDVLNRLRLFAK